MPLAAGVQDGDTCSRTDVSTINAEIAQLDGYVWSFDDDGYLTLDPVIDWEALSQDGVLRARYLPAELAAQVSDQLWSDPVACALEWELCRRDMWRFFTSWCWTRDNLDKVRPIKRFPRYGYLEEVTRAHEARWRGEQPEHPHIVCVKPRAILWSIWLALKDLHGLMFREQWSGYMMSIKLRRVDDGGRRSSPNSLFGKVRLSYNLLPEWMRMMAPLDFQQGTIRNDATGAMLHAEVAGDETGVGVQVDEGDIDEAGVIDNLEEILAIAAPGARHLTVGGTPRSADSAFHRLVLNSPHDTTYRKFEFDWWMIPPRRQCRVCHSTKLLASAATMEDYDTGRSHPVMIEHVNAECRPRDGAWFDDVNDRWTSPWFEQATSTMSEDLKRREFERQFFRASVGRVFKSLRRPVHLVPIEKARINFDEQRYEFWDHGIHDATAIWHCLFDGSIVTFIEYFEATNETAAWYCRRKAWVTGEFWRAGECWLPKETEHLYRRLWGPPNRQAGVTISYFGDSAGANRESDGMSWHRRFAIGARARGMDGHGYVVGKVPMKAAPKPLIEDRIETCKWAIEDGRVLFAQDAKLVASHSDVERGYNRVEAYHRPIDRGTGLVKAARPVHDAASHAADPFGYALVKFFGVRHQHVIGAGMGAL